MVSVLGGGGTAKYGGKVGEKTAVSIGGIAFMDFYQELDRPLAIGFVNVTRGDENKHFTLNLGLSNQTSDRVVSYDWSTHTTTTDDWGNIDYYPAAQTREYLNLMPIKACLKISEPCAWIGQFNKLFLIDFNFPSFPTLALPFR